MKKTILFAAAMLLLAGCYKDKAITPSDAEAGSSKFDFPQQGTPADVQAIFDDIFERYGTKVIYKGFTERDMNRGWLAPSTGSTATYYWETDYYVNNPDKLKLAAEILRDKVLGGLPADKMRPVMQGVQYLYLTESLKRKQYFGVTPYEEVIPMYPSSALDGQGINLQLSAQDDDQYYRAFYPALIIANLFDRAYSSGVFTVSQSFWNEVGNGSGVKNNVQQSYANSLDGKEHDSFIPTWEDYWAQRGLIPTPYTFSGKLYIGKHYRHPKYTYDPRFAAAIPDVTNAFLYMCMDPNWRTFGAAPGEVDNTLTGIYYNTRLFKRLDILSTELKAQGIDVATICTNLYEGTGIYTSPDMVYVPGESPAADIRKYIYADSK